MRFINPKTDLTTAELEDLERREMFIYDQQGAIALGLERGLEQGRQEGKKKKNLRSRVTDSSSSTTPRSPKQRG